MKFINWECLLIRGGGYSQTLGGPISMGCALPPTRLGRGWGGWADATRAGAVATQARAEPWFWIFLASVSRLRGLVCVLSFPQLSNLLCKLIRGGHEGSSCSLVFRTATGRI